VLHPGILGLAAAISLTARRAAAVSEPSFVIEFEMTEKPEHLSLLLQRMTAAERAVAITLRDGLSNQEVADQLGKSVQAVKFLLHTIYTKTGVSSRAALVAALRSGQPQAV
jgi:DNA-binding CsgD family transcriptional regulator